jgi:hypothetical protein
MYDQNNHYTLEPQPWDEAKARQTIQEIIDDHIEPLRLGCQLPRHPMDGYGVMSDLYMGLAGVVWALSYLKDQQAADVRFDSTQYLDELLLRNQEDLQKQPHKTNSSYFIGDLPLLLQKFKANATGEIADRIFASLQINNTEPIRELMWGTPGTMLCASFMFRWTQEPRWKEEFRHQATRLLADWQEHESIGWLWTQDLYGSMRAFLGPVHGFAGNAIPLIEGQGLLDGGDYSVLAEKLMHTTVNAAIEDDRHANWPAVYNAEKPEKLRLVQHCHGAPGMISALSKLPSGINPDFDTVLLKGGELTWSAGPLKKGANLCHGTAGNGYAFLKLHERTADEIWLHRARAFAMESIDQCRQTKALFRQARYTL